MSSTKFRHKPHQSFHRLLDDIFNRDISQSLGQEHVQSIPRVNIIENNEAFVLEVAAPGLSKDQFKLSLDKDRLVIKHNMPETSGEGTKTTEKYTRREFQYQGFERSFVLPNTLDREHIQATYINGVLRITLPKLANSNSSRREISID